MKRNLAALALAAFAVSGLSSPVQAQSRSADQLEAAIVFKILKFVTLTTRSEESLSFCVERGAKSAPALLSLQGQRVREQRLAVRLVNGQNFRGCDVAYLRDTSAAAIEKARAKGRLVIGRGTRFIDANGTIGLVQTGGQIRFEVNLDEAERAGLKISSRLVRLAARVER
ncbi:MAG: YfiR family protein [Pseudomonadota bacterium]